MILYFTFKVISLRGSRLQGREMATQMGQRCTSDLNKTNVLDHRVCRHKNHHGKDLFIRKFHRFRVAMGCLHTKCMRQNAALSCLSNRRKGRNTSNGCLPLTTLTKHSSSSLRALRRASATRHNSLPELSRRTSFPGFILAH